MPDNVVHINSGKEFAIKALEEKIKEIRESENPQWFVMMSGDGETVQLAYNYEISYDIFTVLGYIDHSKNFLEQKFVER